MSPNGTGKSWISMPLVLMFLSFSANAQFRHLTRDEIQELRTAMETGGVNLDPEILDVALTPDLPVQDDVNCHFEVSTPERVGGRCIRLGTNGEHLACQAGVHLHRNNQDCINLWQQRNTNRPRQSRRHRRRH